MRITEECLGCLLNRVRFEAATSYISKGIKPSSDILDEHEEEAKRFLEENHDPANPEISTDLATRMHRQVYHDLKDDDPYKVLKMRATKVALALLPEFKEWVDDTSDEEERLRRRLQLAIAGNVIDFGAPGSSEIETLAEELRVAASTPLCNDDVNRLMLHLEETKGKGEILFFTDNCGEIVLDIPLVEWLTEFGHNVKIIAKPKPMLTDATVEDCEEVGLCAAASGGCGSIGGNSVGVIAEEVPETLAKKMRETPLLISKGMGNYEALTDQPQWGPRLYLLKAKCGPVAAHAGVPVGSHISALVYQ